MKKILGEIKSANSVLDHFKGKAGAPDLVPEQESFTVITLVWFGGQYQLHAPWTEQSKAEQNTTLIPISSSDRRHELSLSSPLFLHLFDRPKAVRQWFTTSQATWPLAELTLQLMLSCSEMYPGESQTS